VATLVWDQVGERFYQTGVDRGVLYLQDGIVVPWNGLIGVEESPNAELKSYYLDGVKYLENLLPGDYVGKLKAYTYPDEFDSVNGLADVAPGLTLYDQPPKSFNLSYRTRIGNDLKGLELGYKIHVLYNVVANPESHSFDTVKDSGVQPIEFSWSLTGTPQKIAKARPTIHVSIDSTKTDPFILGLLESKLYGTDILDPSFPSMKEITEIFGYRGALIIIDYGNGVWLAIDESDTYITMDDDTTFHIDGADVIILDADTYEISSTNVS
jgi:hypothetical protein